MKKWRILNKVKGQFSLEKALVLLLSNRGLKTQKAREEFLDVKDLSKFSERDLGLKKEELKKAVSRVKKAIKKKEKVVIYGDYDADGICATAILWEALNGLGVQVMPFIPERKEGYGLKIDRLKILKKEGVALVITVDNGIVHYSQAKKARELGLDLIITDHHLLGKKKPKALSIIHTTKLAGCGVAWFLARHLEKTIAGKTNFKKDLDLVTIGSIADVVPLLGANRALVKAGLETFSKTSRLGIKELFSLSGLSLDNLATWQIAFIVAPRLNASGRLEDPMDSLRLLCTRDQARAARLAFQINTMNQERQKILGQMTLKARSLWLASGGTDELIFIASEEFHEGIIGLTAGKLMEEFSRPAIVISKGESISKASARSVEGFNIVEAIRKHASLLEGYGGHPKAAGFSIETAKIDLFKKKIVELARQRLEGKKLKPVLKIDFSLFLKDVNFYFYRGLVKLSPFGEGNPEPVFASFGLSVVGANLVGKNKKHLQLTVSQEDGEPVKAIGFNCGSFYPQLAPGVKIDLAFGILLNSYQGRESLQLKVKDLRLSEEKNK